MGHRQLARPASIIARSATKTLGADIGFVYSVPWDRVHFHRLTCGGRLT